jgi:hypothetical protein
MEPSKLVFLPLEHSHRFGVEEGLAIHELLHFVVVLEVGCKEHPI